MSEWPFDPETWNITVSARLGTQAVSGQVLAELASSRKDIVVLTADLMSSNRTLDFAKEHPGKFFNLGIAEQNMVSIAAGLATMGKLPYVATFASFLGLLCCEQIRTDVAYPNLPVRFLAHHSGISLGFYGTSHHATEDLAILRSMANMTVVSLADGNAIRAALRKSLDYPGPIYFRLGRGREPVVYTEPPEFEFGRAIRLREGRDVTILATGLMVSAALEAADSLSREHGIEARVVDVHTIKPLDVDEVLRAARETEAILTVEEHNILGGLGGAVAEVLAEGGVSCRFRRQGIRDEYVIVGPPLALYAHYGLDAQGVLQNTLALLRS